MTTYVDTARTVHRPRGLKQNELWAVCPIVQFDCGMVRPPLRCGWNQQAICSDPNAEIADWLNCPQSFLFHFKLQLTREFHPLICANSWVRIHLPLCNLQPLPLDVTHFSRCLLNAKRSFWSLSFLVCWYLTCAVLKNWREKKINLIHRRRSLPRGRVSKQIY